MRQGRRGSASGGLGRAIDEEFAAEGAITIIAARSTPTASPISPGRRQLGIPVAEAQRILADVTLLKRFGEPRELAPAVVFVTSPRASFTSGIMLDIDGRQVQVI